MARTGRISPIVRYGADRTAYLIVDSLGARGSEIEIERSDLETIISDLMAGQFNDPLRIFALNTLAHRSEDVSKQVAEEIQERCDIDARPIPEHIRDFVDNHTCQAPTAFTLYRRNG